MKGDILVFVWVVGGYFCFNVFVLMWLLLLEIGRNVVGDGLVRFERWWSRMGWDLLKYIKRYEMIEEEEGRYIMEEVVEKKVSIYILVRILGEKEVFVIVMVGVLFLGGYFMVLIMFGF